MYISLTFALLHILGRLICLSQTIFLTNFRINEIIKEVAAATNNSIQEEDALSEENRLLSFEKFSSSLPPPISTGSLAALGYFLKKSKNVLSLFFTKAITKYSSSRLLLCFH